MSDLYTNSFLRLHQILKIFPISKSTWWSGVKAGRFPQSLKIGRCTIWRAEDINELIKNLNSQNNITEEVAMRED